MEPKPRAKLGPYEIASRIGEDDMYRVKAAAISGLPLWLFGGSHAH